MAEHTASAQSGPASAPSGPASAQSGPASAQSGTASDQSGTNLAGQTPWGARAVPDGRGHFDQYGGVFVPEALNAALVELDEAYQKAIVDPAFRVELGDLLRNYAGRPTPLTEATRFSTHCGNARIVLKREDLNHTGSHKINNVLGQALLTQRMGKTRIIAETGAGQHGVASATAAALLGLECRVYMGKVDTDRQALNVARMQLLGAEVVAVEAGSATLKDAMNEAMREWVATVDTTHYLIGSASGPHPFPALVRDLQAVISREAREQFLHDYGRLPDVVAACVGGGSNSMGSFAEFLDDDQVALYGFEAAGDGADTDRTAASINSGRTGVLHGARTYLLQDEDGQTQESHSVSAGLDYPAVGPQHAYMHDIGRVTYEPVTDTEAMDAFSLLSRTEGLMPAIESAHAVAGARRLGLQLAETHPDLEPLIMVTLSGRGDKDVQTAIDWFGITGEADMSDGAHNVLPEDARAQADPRPEEL